ncbi:hypothetical protein HJG60_008092 [Phyllostomus discolor]|uniref:Uncharacterized protein n=1 Tax=Phyllostomus discolor TaxID=89673 RepID=A0A834BDR6_9CHIR|nr:hypothetical protein HJG60_008092 [Phyllostomus discolor]
MLGDIHQQTQRTPGPGTSFLLGKVLSRPFSVFNSHRASRASPSPSASSGSSCLSSGLRIPSTVFDSRQEAVHRVPLLRVYQLWDLSRCHPLLLDAGHATFSSVVLGGLARAFSALQGKLQASVWGFTDFLCYVCSAVHQRVFSFPLFPSFRLLWV